MEKPYCQATAMSQGDNKGLEDMAETGLCWYQTERSQMDMSKPQSQDPPVA